MAIRYAFLSPASRMSCEHSTLTPSTVKSHFSPRLFHAAALTALSVTASPSPAVCSA